MEPSIACRAIYALAPLVIFLSFAACGLGERKAVHLPEKASGNGGKTGDGGPIVDGTSSVDSCGSLPVSMKEPNYFVGPSRPYSTPCTLFSAGVLKPGDVIQIDQGTYTETCAITTSGTADNPIVVRGAPGARPILDGLGLNLTGIAPTPRALWQFNGASHWQIQHLEFQNATNSLGNHSENAAAFRIAGGGIVLASDIVIHHTNMGIMSDGSVTLLNSEVHHSVTDGSTYNHNLYLSGNCALLVGNYIHDSSALGQNVKLRSRWIELRYNYIANGGNYEIDLIQDEPTAAANSHAVLIGNVVVRNPAAGNNSQTILFGSDDASQVRNGNLYAINNTFILKKAANILIYVANPAPSSKVHLYNNIIHSTISGATISASAAQDGFFIGTNNWVSDGVTYPAGLSQTLFGASPGFKSATDYSLAAGSAVIGGGTLSATYLDHNGEAQSALPAYEFIAPFGLKARASGPSIDVGAFAH